MNAKRRRELRKAITLLNDAQANLESAKEIIADCQEEEQECYDCLPEGIQDSDRGEEIQENADALESIADEVESLYDSVQEQIEAIEEVI